MAREPDAERHFPRRGALTHRLVVRVPDHRLNKHHRRGWETLGKYANEKAARQALDTFKAKRYYADSEFQIQRIGGRP